MLYTLTMNPAIDMNISTRGIFPETVNRTFNAVYTPNGKGLNVSFVLRHFGRSSKILGFFGGFSGSYILSESKRKGYRLAICSNAFMIHIEHVLKAIGLRNYFDAVGSLEMGSHKPEVLHGLLHVLKPSAACMVGDRRFDLEAAQQNQIPLIGCAYGYAPDEIRDAAAVVTKPCQIPEAVRQLM